MKVKMKRHASPKGGLTYYAGREYEVNDRLGQKMILRGVAEEIKEPEVKAEEKSKAQLEQEAQEKGVEVKSGDTKKDIAAKIEGSK